LWCFLFWWKYLFHSIYGSFWWPFMCRYNEYIHNWSPILSQCICIECEDNRHHHDKQYQHIPWNFLISYPYSFTPSFYPSFGVVLVDMEPSFFPYDAKNNFFFGDKYLRTVVEGQLFHQMFILLFERLYYMVVPRPFHSRCPNPSPFNI